LLLGNSFAAGVVGTEGARAAADAGFFSILLHSSDSFLAAQRKRFLRKRHPKHPEAFLTAPQSIRLPDATCDVKTGETRDGHPLEMADTCSSETESTAAGNLAKA
jgi:hypothetical protein